MDNDWGFKFEIGDVVRHVGAPKYTGRGVSSEVRMVIVTCLLEKCSGGIQRSHDCRGVLHNGDVIPRLLRCNEVELVASRPFGVDEDDRENAPCNDETSK